MSRKNIIYDLDINIEFLKKSKVNIDAHFILANITTLPFKPRSFDVVICREVIEHLPKKKGEQALKEISKVLKIGAPFICSTPNRLSPEGIIGTIGNRLKLFRRKWNAWDPTHKHIYCTFEFKNLLENHFRLKDLRGEFYLFFPLYTLARTYPLIFRLLRSIMKLMEPKLGRIPPFDGFGFVIEYLAFNAS